MVSQYNPLRLRTIADNSLIQKEEVYFLMREHHSYEVRDAALAVLQYRDSQDSLFPSARKTALRQFRGLAGKVQDAELQAVVKENISYLEEKGTAGQKAREAAAAAGVVFLSLLFPLGFSHRNTASDW